jgi:hypothetical protein
VIPRPALPILAILACTQEPSSAQTPHPPPVALSAVEPGLAPPVAPPVALPVAPKPDDGRVFAIVQVIDRIEECSNAGGEHYVLQLADGRLAHAGGHDIRLDLIPQTGPVIAHGAPPATTGRTTGRTMIAELILDPPRDPDKDGNPDSSRSGWCLDRLPRFSGSATRLLPARDAAEAARLLAQVERLGMPPSTIALAPPTTHDEIAVARVREVDAEHGFSVELEPIEGRAPARLELPRDQARFQFSGMRMPARGDLVVVGTSAGKPTRVLLPDDLASARRWAAEIRRDRWPVDPIVLPYALTTARWTTVASVTAGSSACGLTVRAPHGHGSAIMLPLDAPAPAGAKRGDRLIVIMTARATADACGHTARVVRAYPAPKDVTLDTFRGVIPPDLAPIVE